MTTSKPRTRFWMALATVNGLTLVYPIILLRRAGSVEENLFAAFAFIGSIFLLVVLDAISIVVADTVGPTKR